MNFQRQEKEETRTIKEQFIQDFKQCFLQQRKKKKNTEIVFLCIGTDSVIGDCLGPLVGTNLEEKITQYNISNLNVYGTLEKNISYSNLKEKIQEINKKHPNACQIVIDAALSKEETIGKIFVEEGKVTLGKALQKEKIEVGDIAIKAILGKNYTFAKHNFLSLQNVSLNSIMLLAKMITEGILEVMQYI